MILLTRSANIINGSFGERLKRWQSGRTTAVQLSAPSIHPPKIPDLCFLRDATLWNWECQHRLTMKNTDCQTLADLRVKEAEILLKAGHFSGAYYMAGYSVELAFKACIAKQFRRDNIPEKDFVNKIHTHDLQSLLGLAGLKQIFENDAKSNVQLKVNWSTVIDWTEQDRYDHEISEIDARDLLNAITDPTDGVLLWVKKRW